MSAGPTLRWLDAEAVAPEPWRNGGGSTRTLWAWPVGAGGDDWRLRISLADIARDGPFSPFAGVQRWFTVVQGPGVRLSFADRVLDLTPDREPLHFDGANAPGCTLIDGPTRDLNLMLRGVAGGLQVAVPGVPWTAPAGAWRACFCTGAGRLHVGARSMVCPAMGLAVETRAAPAAALAWRWLPESPEARAWWLWADLSSSTPSPL